MIKNNLKCIVKKFKIQLTFFLIMSLFSWAINLVIPYTMGNFIDSLGKQADVTIIYKITGITIILSMIAIVGSYQANLSMTKIASDMSYSLKEKLIYHIFKAEQNAINKLDPSYLSQKIVSDSEAIINFLLENTIEFFLKGLTIITVGIYLANINMKIAIMLFLFIPFYILCFCLFKRPLYSNNYEMKEVQNNFFSSIVNRINNVYHIKINSYSENIISELGEEYLDVRDKTLKFTKIAFIFSSLGSMISMFSRITLVFFGGLQILSNRLTIGEFTIINTYFSSLLSAVDYYLKFGRNVQNVLVSYRRLEELVNMEREVQGEDFPKEIQEIKFENVRFSYVPQEQILYNFSYVFKKGQIYCIYGENGVGKTSLINLLLKVYNPQEGSITVNGINYNNIDFDEMRKKTFSVCEQNISLFRNTICENIEYGIEEIDYEKITTFLQKYGISEMLLQKNENTNNELSGGEKQKIALLHTLLKKAEIYIFDEPTNFLDKESIDNLCEEFLRLKQEAIVIVISHDYRMQNLADKKIKIENK